MLDHLATLPDDWDSWLVYADQLTQRGDRRGEILVLEHRGARDEAILRTDAWVGAVASHLGVYFTDAFFWISRFRPFVDPRTPPEVRSVFAQPVSQLIALLDPDERVHEVPPVLQRYIDRVYAALLAWLELAFDAPVPGLGRWQDLDDDELLARGDGLQAIDATNLPYYAPAVLRFALRKQHAREKPPGSINTSVWSLLLHPVPQVRNTQQQRFASLERRQREVMYAIALALDYTMHTGEKEWATVWNAEREGVRADWFELFYPAPAPSTPPAPAKGPRRTNRSSRRKHPRTGPR